MKETGTALEKLDHVMLRRYLVDAGHLCRPADGSSYRVVADPPRRPRCEAGVADVDLADLLQARREEVAHRKAEYLAGQDPQRGAPSPAEPRPGQ